MKLNKITFRAGQSAGCPPLEIKPSTVILLVGPNNSGKSLALREIESYCKGQNAPYGQPQSPKKVINDIEVLLPKNVDDAKKLLMVFTAKPPQNASPPEIAGPEDFWISAHTFDRSPTPGFRPNLIRIPELNAAITNYERMKQILCPLYTVRLDGQTRFSLIEPTEAGNLADPPHNHLWALDRDEEKRKRVSDLTKEAFGLHFLVDPTDSKILKIRLSIKCPEPDEEGRSTKAVAFYNSVPVISEFGDGVKAFTGLVCALLSLPHKIILIDEPEAFLHPPLANLLGQRLSNIAAERDASLIVSTHSSEFLIGCVNSGVAVSVVRLTYEKKSATARNLDPHAIRTIMRDPLMRSADVLRAFFSRAALVAESDSDRAFYEEINRRLLDEGRGIKDSLFLNAQNVGTLCKIVGPLRKIGVPAAAIPDLDFLTNNDGDWENMLDACEIPKKEWLRIQTERKAISKTGKNLKENGLDILEATEKTKIEHLLTELESYGLFIVPVGQLECWLKGIGAKNEHGSKWLIDLFPKIGSSKEDANYLRPTCDDVWLFIDKIGKWIDSKMATPDPK